MVPVIFRYKNVPITAYRRPLQKRIPSQSIASHRRQRTHVGAGAGDAAGVPDRKNTGFVAGGSWDFAMAIADRYTRLGGVLRIKRRVTSVKVENSRAMGVECADGTFVPGFNRRFLRGRPHDDFQNAGRPVCGQKNPLPLRELQNVSGHHPGLAGNQEDFPRRAAYAQPAAAPPLRVDDQTRHDRLEVETFGSESGLCPEGTTVMTVRLPTRYEFWTELKKNDPQRYRAEKESLIQEIIAILDKRFPGLAQHIERSDIATPATFVRYTGNWQGSYEGWLPTPRILGRHIPYTLPGLKNFYMAGHWVVAGGGLPSAAISGRYVAQMICAQNGKVFAATGP